MQNQQNMQSAAQPGAAAQVLDQLSFDLKQSSLIEASAGTGKTFTITYLILRLLLNAGEQGCNLDKPLDLENILVVTFTNAAASDLKLRIREKIRDARLCLTALKNGEDISACEPQMQRLADILLHSSIKLADYIRVLQRAERNIDKAAICTIHSFCNSALNQIYAFEAGEAFETELSADVSALEEEAFNQVWRECFYQGPKEEPLLRFLLERIGAASPSDLQGDYDNLQKVRLSTRDKDSLLEFSVRDNTVFLDRKCKKAGPLFADLKKQAAALQTELKNKLPELKERVKSALGPDFTELLRAGCAGAEHALLNLTSGKQAVFSKDGMYTAGRLLKFIDAPADAVVLPFDSEQALEKCCPARLISYYNRAAKHMPHAGEFEQALSAVRAILAETVPLAVKFARLGIELRTALSLMVSERVEELKEQQQLMSYDDVLLRLNRALQQKDRGDRLAAMIRERYEAAMIDEFQDTDPVQYAIFEKLYLSDAETAKKARCYLIGDPKQSIYAFRGSDINSYLKAAKRINELSHGSAVYTLNRNFRSAPGVVNSVNALFSSALNPLNTRPFLTDDVTFAPVSAAGGKQHFHFKDEAEGAACYINYVEADGKTNKEAASRAAAKACAALVLRCLNEGVLEDRIDGAYVPRALKPSDIAVLVRSSKESALVIDALRSLNISGVFFSDKSSVLKNDGAPTLEAQELLFLMEAVCDCASRQKVSRLLGSRLLSLSGAEYQQMMSDEMFEAEVRLLSSLQQEWRENGFFPAFMRWFKDPLHQGLSKTLEFTDGDRMLTNYLHIAELIQKKHGRISGIKAQLRWFDNLIHDVAADDETAPDEVVQRLESEREQVQIRTIHNSKGLEFAVVLLPFLWSADMARRSNGAAFFYDPNLKRRTLDLYAEQDSSKAAERADLQEDMRLTYVALTRACAANFIILSKYDVRPQMLPRGLVRLLVGDSSEEPGAGDGCKMEDQKALTALEGQPELFTCFKTAEKELNHLGQSYQPAVQADGALTVSTLPEGAVQSSFNISSYTAIVSGLHGSAPRLLDNESADDPSIDDGLNENPQLLSPFGFPRGTKAGTFLHSLLERLTFEEERDEFDLRAVALDALTTYGTSVSNDWTALQSDAADALAAWLEDMLHAPLLFDHKRPLHLCDLKAGDYVTEMRYLMPAEALDTAALNELCRENAAAQMQLPSHLKDKLLREMHLTERTVSGFLTGSLDLVCSFELDGRPRYFVVDYKSTYLGADYGAYSAQAVEQSVYDSRNRYDVQYLIYTLALHRMLRGRIADYSYERDVGGVMYLYLRGLKAGKERSPGVYYTKPSLEVIEQLDRMFGGNYA
ncbi:MAG: exodeoxyribonuclease V subunit beta [Proteobacteria bacterium]|uniref:RecBCD enzyme subunit RecB n=1 Tax=Candidatus Avisuccinivibrio stercorigallinarum TaxID=2840704 RepID=A0A9D9DBK2_9GAMM|nr:exodeoxyribonuclease V subunit beta [Candidatus Avisuccinivibrio stercorigallinarum]